MIRWVWGYRLGGVSISECLSPALFKLYCHCDTVTVTVGVSACSWHVTLRHIRLLTASSSLVSHRRHNYHLLTE